MIKSYTDGKHPWLDAYLAALDARDLSAAIRLGERFLCPCCMMPTLTEPGAYDICLVCWWEDDGQGDPDADLAPGGPNGRYSLTQARKNFARNGFIYEAGQEIDDLKTPSQTRIALVEFALDVHHGRREFDLARFEDLLAAEEART